MMFKGLHEDHIQNLHKTTPEQLTNQDLLLSTISEEELVRKHFGGWVKEYPKCFFCSKVLRFKTFTVQCHMTSQITDSGKHKCKTTVCEFENKKDDSPLKTRFLTVRKEIYNRYTEKEKTEQQTTSPALEQGMSECEWQSEVIEIDTDITDPGTNKQTNRTDYQSVYDCPVGLFVCARRGDVGVYVDNFTFPLTL